MTFSLDAKEVKKIMDAKLNGRPHDEKQFMYYHLHRNFFNVKSEITSLKKMTGNNYLDNLGNTWEEQQTIKNFFHMPKGNWVGSLFGVSTPYSRKFLRDDDVSGIGGEFEIVIRHDGKRIDAFTHEDFQETYNFGRTRNWSAHTTLDVNPHNKNSGYTFKMSMGSVHIIG